MCSLGNSGSTLNLSYSLKEVQGLWILQGSFCLQVSMSEFIDHLILDLKTIDYRYIPINRYFFWLELFVCSNHFLDHSLKWHLWGLIPIKSAIINYIINEIWRIYIPKWPLIRKFDDFTTIARKWLCLNSKMECLKSLNYWKVKIKYSRGKCNDHCMPGPPIALSADITWLGVSKNFNTQFWNCFLSSVDRLSVVCVFFKVFSLQMLSIFDIRAIFASAAALSILLFNLINL